MKVGEQVSLATIEMIASTREIEAGLVQLRHPRCGRVIIRLQGRAWTVTECERPDRAK